MGRSAIFALLLVGLASLPSNAIGPPVRSTRYDGTNQAFASFAHSAAYDASVPMTIEAWIYREDANRCETIAGHHFQDSWWFGLCPSLRFYRSGGKSATSSVAIAALQWTHVAVTYDGSDARFYINGQLTDTIPLTNAGGGRSYPLVIGADSNGGPFWFPFRGNIDEVRVWSTVRTQQQISENRFKELRSGGGLVAAFGTGGNREDLASVTGTAGSGTAERILGILPRDLVVPKAAVTPTVDGQINVAGEYAGAEQLVVPYHAANGDPDATAYLVYTDTGSQNLYIGVYRPRHNEPGIPYEGTTFGVLLDPTFSRNATPQASDVWFHTFLHEFFLPFDPNNTRWWNGNGFDFSQCLLPGNQPCTPASAYQIGKAWCTGNEFDLLPPCVEFRIPKSQLGDWTEFDALALIHLNWGAGGAFTMAPEDAESLVPATWPKVSYGDTAATLPRARISGRVHAGLTAAAPGLANRAVFLSSGGVGHQTTTDANGNYSFDVPIALDQQVEVRITSSSSERYSDATATGPGIPGAPFGDLAVKYPGCTGAVCQYQNANFFVLRAPPGPVTLASANPPSPTPKVTLRDNPTLLSANAASITTFTGTNLHPFIDVYLSPFIPTLNCPCPDDWVLFKGTVLSVSPDGTTMTVRAPTLPGRVPLRQGQAGGSPFGSQYRWVFHDTWSRPGIIPYVMYPSLASNPKSFPLTEPEYPQIWGFGFRNEDKPPGWREFSAVYGRNAYYCLFGACVMDPLYAIFYPIYWLVGKAMTGSCGGMASTSLMFRFGQLQTQQFDPNVYFPAGFRQEDQNYQPSWSRSEWEVTYGAAAPTNLWAWVRVGQMVQISNEFLGRVLSQTCLEADWNPFCGHPADRLGEITGLGYVACMIDSITQGHNVTPYAVSGGTIKVYDNNLPYNINSVIEVTGDSYSFANTGYSGTGLYTIPMSLWTSGRTAPLFGTLDLLAQFVAGNADPLITTSDGKRWGWMPDGTFVNEIPGSVTLTPQSGLYEARSVPLFLPKTKANPQIKINARGGDYYVHSGNNGVVAQLHAFDSIAGDTDNIQLNYDAEGLRSFDFTPQRAASHALPAVGMKIGADSSLLFRWIGLNVPAAKTAGFGALKSQLGAEYVNLTGAATNAYMLVDAADGTAQAPSQVLFGPINVPNNASQKSIIQNWPTNTTIQLDVDLDRNGTVDQTSTIQGVVPAQMATVGEAKLLANGALVNLGRVVSTTSANTFNGFFYCQDADRAASGIKVIAAAAQLPSVVPGSMLQVIGTMSTDSNGERQIINPIILVNHAEDAPRPLAMRNAAVGGGTLGVQPGGQIGVTGGEGPNTIGLLIKTTGRVTSLGASTATLTDGSGSVVIGTATLPFVNFETGSHVTVTGICAQRIESGQRKRFILPRSAADVVVH